MFKKFTTTDKLLFISAFLSLIFSELLYFRGEANAAIFIGIWVPSILAFGIYLKLVNHSKNDWNNTLFRRPYYIAVCRRFFIGIKRNEKTKTLNAANFWRINNWCVSDCFLLYRNTVFILFWSCILVKCFYRILWL